MLVYSKERITKEQVKNYCESFTAGTPYDIAIMELHRILNCPEEILTDVVKESVEEIGFYWDSKERRANG